MATTQLLLRVLVTLGVVALALVAGWLLWDYYLNDPWTRDARVRAEVVEVAADVSGTVTAVHVADDQFVRVGEPMFTIDDQRFRLAAAQAEALLTARQASLEQARHDADRARRLGNNAITVAARERLEAEERVAAATVRQAQADLEVARLDLERTVVRAPVEGLVTNLQLNRGDFAAAGSPVVALVDSNSFHVVGYFEETRLPRIRVGARVDIRLMGGGPALSGRVQSISGGIVDREQQATGGLLANVNPTFNWVRLAQRIPVRIALDPVPQGVRLANGLTATVAIAETVPRPQTP